MRLIVATTALASGVLAMFRYGRIRPVLKFFQTDATSIRQSFSIDFHWPTMDPFLFCAYHRDLYPQGNEQLGPVASMEGRNIGMDFQVKDGFRMYHGDQIPGFPVHPHRGFETVTIVREGLVDHADSLGAAGRYGEGDVQWMTAGAGVQHSEMFPLLKSKGDNPTELFQVWLNLPKASKFAKPHFTMFWRDQVPKIRQDGVTLEIVCGRIGDEIPPAPPPESWASVDGHEVAIWVMILSPGGKVTLPAVSAGVSRVLYFHGGRGLVLGGKDVSSGTGFELDGTKAISLENRDSVDARLLMLQGKAIGEPVVQQGPFVMNTKAEIVQAIDDYRASEFGGWPWQRRDMVHGKEQGRFALFPDGRREEPKA